MRHARFGSAGERGALQGGLMQEERRAGEPPQRERESSVGALPGQGLEAVHRSREREPPGPPRPAALGPGAFRSGRGMQAQTGRELGQKLSESAEAEQGIAPGIVHGKVPRIRGPRRPARRGRGRGHGQELRGRGGEEGGIGGAEIQEGAPGRLGERRLLGGGGFPAVEPQRGLDQGAQGRVPSGIRDLQPVEALGQDGRLSVAPQIIPDAERRIPRRLRPRGPLPGGVLRRSRQDRRPGRQAWEQERQGQGSPAQTQHDRSEHIIMPPPAAGSPSGPLELLHSDA